MLSMLRVLRRRRQLFAFVVLIVGVFGVLCHVKVIKTFPTYTLFGPGPDASNNQLPRIENETLEGFLDAYKDYCTEHVVQKQQREISRVGLAASVNNTLNYTNLCPCVPDTLVGRLNSSTLSIPSFDELERHHKELNAGGSWSPQHCIPRHRVAVIVPFRNRDHHLRALLNVLHPLLQHQLLQYTIFLVEQSKPAVFNKAALMNAGFVESRALSHFDCVIFHDVDMLPEDDRNFYVCSPQPRHVGAYLRQWDYKLPYQNLFGGVTAFRPDHFVAVNGFSNQFYGWGGEDDDMFQRLKAENMSVIRFSNAVARYCMFEHRRDVGNPYNMNSETGYNLRPDHYKIDGLNSVQYRTESTELRPLYTWILVSLPPQPSYIRVLEKDQMYDRDSGHIVRECSWTQSAMLIFGAVILTVVLLVAVHVMQFSLSPVSSTLSYPLKTYT